MDEDTESESDQEEVWICNEPESDSKDDEIQSDMHNSHEHIIPDFVEFEHNIINMRKRKKQSKQIRDNPISTKTACTFHELETTKGGNKRMHGTI